MDRELSDEALAVIEKVKKLLALASNNPNEAEAEAASAKAMELLEAYNLSMAALDARGKQDNTRKDTKRKGGLYEWQRDLWRVVCALNFCRYWSVKGQTKGSTYEHRILGRRENVISAEVMAEYLQQTIERLAQEWAKDRGYNVFCRDAIAYREGMSTRLRYRLNDIRWKKLREERERAQERTAAAPQPGAGPVGNALVLASVVQSEEDLNMDYLNGWEPGTTSRRRAEDKARQAAAMARAEEILKARDAAEEADPRLKEQRLAAERELDEEYQAGLKRAQKKAEAAARRRERNGTTQERYRALTAKERREATRGFADGYNKGGDISLDKQIDKNNPKELMEY